MWKKPAGNFVGWAVQSNAPWSAITSTRRPVILPSFEHISRVHDVVAGEAGRHQVLGAVLDPLDRHAGHDRAGDRAHVARVDRHLVAEAAADVLAADPDHVLGEPGDVRVDRAVRVRRLVAVVDVELAGLRVEVGDDPARLERRRVAARVDDVAADDRVGLGERAVGRLLVAGLPGRAREVVALAGLVVADQRRVGVERLARVDDRRQRLVLDVDQRAARRWPSTRRSRSRTRPPGPGSGPCRRRARPACRRRSSASTRGRASRGPWR